MLEKKEFQSHGSLFPILFGFLYYKSIKDLVLLEEK
jgi:hypothetical protein